MQPATESHNATAQPAPSVQGESSKPKKRIGTIPAATKEYGDSFPSEAGWRDMKFRAFDRKNSRGEVIKGNGTGPAGVWVQVGRKVLVDFDAFDNWLESHRAVNNKGR